MSSLRSKVLRTENVNWKEFKYIQQEGFKELPPEVKIKLKESIVQNNFAQPFYVWQDQQDIYCLDGRHRTITHQQSAEPIPTGMN